MSREIKAVIDRNPSLTQAETGRDMTGVFSIWVSNSATDGISSDEIDTGGDQLLIAKRIGQTPELVQINNIRWQDEGMMLLECR